MTYLARITECEHGQVGRHPTVVVLRDRLGPGKDDIGYDWANICPGGTTTRIEVDYEAAARAQYEFHVRWLVEAAKPKLMVLPEWGELDEEDRAAKINALRLPIDAALGGSEE